MRTSLMVILFFSSIVSLSQSLRSEPALINYTVDNGLPDNTVHDVYCDESGYIWFATEYGVARFNGNKFKYFTRGDGLSDNDILRITFSNKEIWFATFNGIPSYFKDGLVYNSTTDKQLSSFDSLHQFIFTSIRDSEQNLWVSNNRKGVTLITHLGEKKVFYSEERISFLFEYKQEVYGIMEVKGLVKFHPKDLSIETIFSFSASGHQKSYFLNGELTTFTLDNTLLSINMKDFTLAEIPLPTALSESKLVIHASRVYNGKYYICTSDGLYIISNEDEYNHILKGVSITSMCLDKESGIWISTLRHGGYYLPYLSAKKTSIKNAENTLINFINKEDKSLIVGNETILFKETSNGLEKIVFPKLKSTINCVISCNDGLIAVGDAFLAVLGNDESKEFEFIGKWALVNDSDLYIGTYRGTCRIPIDSVDSILPIEVYENPNTFETFISGIEIIDKKTREILQLKDDGLALVTSEGLFVYKKGPTRLSDTIHQLLRGSINSIAYDGENILWLGTEDNGLIQYNLKNSDTERLEQIKGESIKSVFYDQKNHLLCIGSNKGLEFYGEDYSGRLTQRTALPSSEVNRVTVFSNQVYGLTSKGLYNVAIEEIINSDFRPSVRLEEMGTNQAITNEMTLETTYDVNDVYILVEAISFKQRVEFNFRLNGGNWKKSKDGFISFSSLSPGYYAIDVKAISDNLMESKEINLIVRVLPPCWETGWFKGSVFLVILLIIYLFFRLNVLAYNRQVVKEILQLIVNRLKKRKKIELKNTIDGAKTPFFLDDILRIEGAKEYIKVITLEKNILVKKSMKKVLEELNTIGGENTFIQVHKSHIVKRDRVEAYHYQFVQINEEKIPVGRYYRPILKEFFS